MTAIPLPEPAKIQKKGEPLLCKGIMIKMQDCKECQKDSSFFRFLVIMKRFHILASSLHNMPLNVSHTDFHTMSYIVKSTQSNTHGVTIGELAKALQISAPAVSRAISSLEKRGYVKRTVDLNNRRSVTVTPTENGILAINEDKVFFERITKNISQKLGDEKLETLEILLNQLYKTVYDTIEEERNSL